MEQRLISKKLPIKRDMNERTIEFTGLSILKEGHYLKIINKGAHVESYEEVDKKEVPKKALAIIG